MDTASDMAHADRRPLASVAGLRLGPILRYVDATRATIWVETTAPCAVTVLDRTARTFTAHGHHYALIDIDGLTPGSSTPYTVSADGRIVWPEPDTKFPASRVRTPAPDAPLRLVFGSCRTAVRHDAESNKTHGVDVLRAFGQRLTEVEDAAWPDLLLLLGDQVYADEASDAMKEFIAGRRSVDVPPGTELADFEEYTKVYEIAWSEPLVRWVLSTLPSMMIFDDHDIRDDWNTSLAWRDEMAQQTWWHKRIVGGLGSYWIYQHLGNVAPEERADDHAWQQVRLAEGDAGAVIDAMAASADTRPERHRWSYARDFGRRRIVVLDSRAGRVLTAGHRSMLDDQEWAWFDELAQGDVDHLLIGTSLPYLLPRGLHEFEQWDEAVGDGRWGTRARQTAERIRQGVDLEHWAAFHDSFTAMADVIKAIARGERGAPPATVIFLSGDVHYSYLMRARDRDARAADDQMPTRIFQAVCSPIRNPLSRVLRYANTVASFAGAGLAGRLLARSAGLRETALDWSLVHGPVFDNALATLDLDGRRAAVRWETASHDADAETSTVHEIAAVDLTA